MSEKEREVGRVTECEVGIEDHGILTAFVSFEFDGKIYMIEPLHKKDGQPFDLEEWSKFVSGRPGRISAHEARTGKKPPKE